MELSGIATRWHADRSGLTLALGGGGAPGLAYLVSVEKGYGRPWKSGAHWVTDFDLAARTASRVGHLRGSTSPTSALCSNAVETA